MWSDNLSNTTRIISFMINNHCWCPTFTSNRASDLPRCHMWYMLIQYRRWTCEIEINMFCLIEVDLWLPKASKGCVHLLEWCQQPASSPPSARLPPASVLDPPFTKQCMSDILPTHRPKSQTRITRTKGHAIAVEFGIRIDSSIACQISKKDEDFKTPSHDFGVLEIWR